jgi:hypothetical protein
MASAQSTFDKWPAIKEFHDVIRNFSSSRGRKFSTYKIAFEEMMSKAALLTALSQQILKQKQ